MNDTEDDIVITGTARHRREWGFPKPLTQSEIAALCEPKVSKAWVSQFEKAKFKLDRSGALRAAPAYFPELWKENQAEAVKRTWLMWFINVEHYGDDSVKRYAEAMRPVVLAGVESAA